MRRFIGRSLACLLLAAMLVGTVPAGAVSAGFTDVPADSWAAADIRRCVELGLFQGETPTRFGKGHQMTRAAFTVVLCRLFGWDMETPETGTYADVQDTGAWYFSAVETACAHGAITRQTENFRPQAPITREEMAVMLVRALGWGTIAGLAQDLPMPFTDVSTNVGYISMAYELGIVNGTSAATFSPDRTATREQAAVMLMRVYDKYRAAAPSLVGIAAGGAGDWSGYEAVAITGGRLALAAGRVQVTSPSAERAEALRSAARAAGVKALLHVTGGSTALQGKPVEIAEALAQAAADYDGVYLDLPQLADNRRTALTETVAALREKLGEKLLYVTAEAPAWQGKTYSAYDYAALAASADRLVLRVAPYQKTADGFTVAPLEPMEEVYYALAELKGTVPAGKLSLLLTTAGSQWKNGKRVSNADSGEIAELLADEQNTESYYSSRYACAYLAQKMQGNTVTVWYLDRQAAEARRQMCAFFGVDQICLSDMDAMSADVLEGLR